MYIELKGTSAWNKQSYEFWKKLRDYNLTLDEENKIKVIGIDIEHQEGTALSYLTSLIPEAPAPDKIHDSINNFKIPKKELKTRDDVKELVKTLKGDIESNIELYKEYLGDNFFDFSLVVDNISSTVDAYNSNDSGFNEIREKQIYSNFKKVYEHFPKGKYFGQFGKEHVTQRCYNSWLDKQERFAMYLNSDDSPLKRKVLSMAYGYKDCYRMTWPSNDGGKYGKAKTDPGIFNMDIIDEYCEKDITVFKLHGENSPFNNKPYFVKGPYGGVTTDYYQYLFLIKDSRGSTPLED